MPFTIEIDDRDWDVDNLINALKLPVERNYVAEITVDRPEDADIVFQGDVWLRGLADEELHVVEWDEGVVGAARHFNVADIRRISFY